MKFFRYLFFSGIFIFGAVACKKNPENLWEIEIKDSAKKTEIVDISRLFYDLNVPLEDFKNKFPWFQGTVSDEDYAVRRADANEAKIYKEAIAKIDVAKLNKDLSGLFSHIHHYFPEFVAPKVYLYSSALQGIMEPIFYKPEENMLFIDISAFMGENNPNYQGLELYFQKSMNPQNIVPKVSEVFAQSFVPRNIENQKFIDELIYHGKIVTLQDAFLPSFPDYLKMNYTQKQHEWAVENEVNIWNYFVENDLLFSDDNRLDERFLAKAPFSKFYTEIDPKSSPRVGAFIGWQICRQYLEKNPEVTLQKFFKMDAQEIFNQSKYKPKN